MTFDEWEAEFKPVQNHLVKDASYEGKMFETYGVEEDFVRALSNSGHADRVWTLLDGDGDLPSVGSGMHYVNRIGYFITQVPCPADTFIEAIDEF